MAEKFDKNSFKKRLSTMLGVDFRRMFTSPLFYLMIGISLVIPILILVMVTMMEGSVSVNPQTGEETVMEGFKTVWEIIGTSSNVSAEHSAGMAMSITSMCNINMMFFAIAVFVCIFVGDDFRSGYVKNLFTVRSKKSDYVISKTIACFVAGALMIIAFFIGAMIGGKFSGLPFDLQGANAFNVLMCILSKALLVGIFVSIYVLASVIAKQRLWLSILLSLGIGMLMFMMIPIITPLNSTIVNLILCLVGSILFSFGIGFGSKAILNKTSLV
ncbi:MAG: ABC transporter permease [Clostridia bacterium]|nr:ABC transporter permease [Clostridia bacterium]